LGKCVNSDRLRSGKRRAKLRNMAAPAISSTRDNVHAPGARRVHAYHQDWRDEQRPIPDPQMIHFWARRASVRNPWDNELTNSTQHHRDHRAEIKPAGDMWADRAAEANDLRSRVSDAERLRRHPELVAEAADHAAHNFDNALASERWGFNPSEYQWLRRSADNAEGWGYNYYRRNRDPGVLPNENYRTGHWTWHKYVPEWAQSRGLHRLGGLHCADIRVDNDEQLRISSNYYEHPQDHPSATLNWIGAHAEHDRTYYPDDPAHQIPMAERLDHFSRAQGFTDHVKEENRWQQQQQQQQQQVDGPSDATEELTTTFGGITPDGTNVTEETTNDVVTNVIYDKETLSWKQKPSKDPERLQESTVEGTLRWNQIVRGESFGAFHGQLPDRILHMQNRKRQRDLEVNRYSKRRTEDRPDHLPAEDDVRSHEVPGRASLYQVEVLEKQLRNDAYWKQSPPATPQYAEGNHPLDIIEGLEERVRSLEEQLRNAPPTSRESPLYSPVSEPDDDEGELESAGPPDDHDHMVRLL